uniref:NADH-ubiquinone oxidoreductase chain 1 n=1 Tax=Bactrothrips quadrituberculatus TaxID=1246465 RepID=A0A8E5JZK7_9NEOP|nr:NADH dehydrogenase subunit 1 [Bactrothrips quadrituberculatus]QVD42819.1 NADH dehydrogenase subunit 1 [Bactrothrips quadrituberculatus]
MILLVFLMMMIFIMIGVAFFTLLERKLLGYIQYRKGPNKVGFIGILQPFSDAIKLFSKEILKPLVSNYSIFFFMPLLNLMINLLVWLLMPFFFSYFFVNLGILFFLCLSSLSVYTIILGSWSSNSNYSMLGSLRLVAQLISYEISFSIILMCFLILNNSLSLYDFYIFQKSIWFFFFMFPLGIMWLISCFAETNRTPFDFSEGESELVSGFNIEYSSVLFAYIFLSEYCSIMFMSYMSVIILFGGNFFSFFFYMKSSLLCFFFIWVRGSLPRFRYDKLMYLNWKIFLPLSMLLILFFSGFSIFLKLNSMN